MKDYKSFEFIFNSQEEEDTIDAMCHDLSEDELRAMDCFNNLNLEDDVQ